MTADRRVRLFPMPAARKDREPEQLPSVLPRRHPTDRAERASIVVNVTAGVVLLGAVVGLVLTYAFGGFGTW